MVGVCEGVEMRGEVRGEEAGVLGNGPGSARFWMCRNGAGLEGGLETGAGGGTEGSPGVLLQFPPGGARKTYLSYLVGDR